MPVGSSSSSSSSSFFCFFDAPFAGSAEVAGAAITGAAAAELRIVSMSASLSPATTFVSCSWT